MCSRGLVEPLQHSRSPSSFALTTLGSGHPPDPTSCARSGRVEEPSPLERYSIRRVVHMETADFLEPWTARSVAGGGRRRACLPCSEWRVRDQVGHTGTVRRWAAA